MQYSALLVGCALAAISNAHPLEPRATFVQVPLTPPLNWISGDSLFPSNIIAGYNAPIADYTSDTWSAYILSQCTQKYSACTSTITFQGTNSGSTGGRFWFGYVHRGGPTTEADYERYDEGGVTDSIAYTIV